MAIKDFYPAIRPTLNLNFAGSRVVDPRITFSRSGTGSIASYFDEKGVMKFAPPGMPRIDFDPITGECKGLLIEEQRTNLLKYSEQFDNATWLKINGAITANATTAPDGTLTADKLVENNVNAEHYIDYVYGVTSGQEYTMSVYVKKADNKFFRLLVVISATESELLFNFDTGAIWSQTLRNTSVVPVGNGWYRFLGTFTATVTGNSVFRCQLVGNGAFPQGIYAGDGTSGIYLWGAQLEQGAFPTSYIPTTSAQVTRAADSASLTGANFSSWYKQDEGTLFAEWATTTVIAPGNLGVFSVSDGTTNERIQIRRNASPYLVSFIALDGGIMQYGDVSLQFNGNAKSALAYKTNDFIGASNGSLGVAATSGTLPSVSQADIGFGTGISQLNGHIKRIAYYPRRLSDVQLKALTS